MIAPASNAPSSSSADNGAAPSSERPDASRNTTAPPDGLRQQASQFRKLMTQPQSAAPEDQAADAEAADGEGISLTPQTAAAATATLRGYAQGQAWSGVGTQAEAQAQMEDDGVPLSELARPALSANALLWRKLQDDSRRQGDAEAGAQLPALQPAPSAEGMPAAASTADPEAVFATLMERHIRQMLVSEPSAAGSDAVRIRLADSTLPGTTLSLTRTADGWHLQANTNNPGSRAALQRYAPALVARFAAGALGSISVEVVSG